MADEKLAKSIQTTFKISGLVITRKLSTYLARQLLNVDEDDRREWLNRITEQILSQELDDPCVLLEHIKAAITECQKPEDSLQDTETVLNVLSAFDVPKIKYDMNRNKFVLEQVHPDLYPDAVHKSLIFKDRLTLLWQRTLNHELFAPVRFGETNVERLQLSPIEYLLSLSKTEHVYVMGLLTQLTEGQYYLEDTTGVIKIDLSGAAAMITEGCIVIANGEFDDGILKVRDIGFPPPENSSNSRAHFGPANTFGGPHPVSLKTSEKLKAFEDANRDEMMVFLSDFWLDNVLVLKKFKTMLNGYSKCPPIAIVICGHFLSFPPNVTSSHKIKEGFKSLAEIVMEYPDIVKNTKFILVPGPYDLGAPKILPRAPLPKYIVEDFVKKVPGVILATNPCRIQYCTKEIVVLREDMLMKLSRNTLHFPADGLVSNHYAKSIVSQSHLTPMSLSVIPVYWKYDQAMQLYPTPDLIVSADQFESYITSFSDCQVVNPGTFPRNDFSFKVYVPALNLIEDCVLPKEDEES